MAPNCTNFATHNDHEHHQGSAAKALECDSVTCGTDRDSIMTRSPSPCEEVGGHVVGDDVRVVIEKLDIRHHEPTRAAERPGLAQHRAKSVSAGLTSKMHHLKKNSGGLFKSFKNLGATGGANGGSIGGESGHGMGGDFSSSDDDSSVGSCEGGRAGPSSGAELPKRWVPRSKSQRGLKMGVLGGLGRTKNAAANVIYTNHSIHASSQLSDLVEDKELRPNSEHDDELTEYLKSTSKDGLSPSVADATKILHGSDSHDASSSDEDARRSARRTVSLAWHERGGSSCVSSFSAASVASADSEDLFYSELDNELDKAPDPFMNSRAMLERLGDSPTSSDLANVAAARAKEYIEECLSAEVSVLDRTKWENIPQYCKSDLLVGQHLGKGTFSDAFEVICTVVEEEEVVLHTKENWNEEREYLDRMIEAKFQKRPSIVAEGGDEMESEIDAMFSRQEGGQGTIGMCKRPSVVFEDGDRDDLDMEIDAMFGKQGGGVGNDMKDLDDEIEAMFGGKDGLKQNEDEGDDLDKEIEAMFGSLCVGGSNDANKEDSQQPKQDEEWKPTGMKSRAQNRHLRHQTTDIGTFGAGALARRRQSTDLAGSFCLGSHLIQGASPAAKKRTHRVVMAMKCLRPQIRSNSEQFMIGVEDLVHETAMLASLDHPHIVKLYGRAGGGCVSNSFRLSDGYFILLDRLKDTLDDRIARWKKTLDKRAPPDLTQVKSASCIADALAYLHSKNIIFRDLKPANVGFDSQGVLKLFDFGFAVGINEPPRSPSTCDSNRTDEEEESHLLYDRCGTPRYMAPEVGLELGYSLPADVYSFGILLWEICALKKPFGKVRSAKEFHKTVFEKGSRPKVNSKWPRVLKDLMTSCWSSFPVERPEMSHVKSMLAAHARELLAQGTVNRGGHNGLRRSSVFRRFTG